ncbi:hypothetical protein D3C81_1601950 [compost metagenome]
MQDRHQIKYGEDIDSEVECSQKDASSEGGIRAGPCTIYNSQNSQHKGQQGISAKIKPVSQAGLGLYIIQVRLRYAEGGLHGRDLAILILETQFGMRITDHVFVNPVS